MKIKNLLCSAVAIVVLIAQTSVAQATLINALGFSDQLNNNANVTSTRGYSFNVTQSGLFATALSIWDLDGDGLNESHTVGLWDPQGTLLASAFIESGTSASLLGSFRYTDILDISLTVGNGYVVAATFLAGSLDKQALMMSNIVTAQGITYATGRFINNNVDALTLPTDEIERGMAGGSIILKKNEPNISSQKAPLTALAVSVPSVVILFVLGLLLLVKTRKTR